MRRAPAPTRWGWPKNDEVARQPRSSVSGRAPGAGSVAAPMPGPDCNGGDRRLGRLRRAEPTLDRHQVERVGERRDDPVGTSWITTGSGPERGAGSAANRWSMPWRRERRPRSGRAVRRRRRVLDRTISISAVCVDLRSAELADLELGLEPEPVGSPGTDGLDRRSGGRQRREQVGERAAGRSGRIATTAGGCRIDGEQLTGRGARRSAGELRRPALVGHPVDAGYARSSAQRGRRPLPARRDPDVGTDLERAWSSCDVAPGRGITRP